LAVRHVLLERTRIVVFEVLRLLMPPSDSYFLPNTPRAIEEAKRYAEQIWRTPRKLQTARWLAKKILKAIYESILSIYSTLG
jgi:hypothetical protein